MLSLTNKELIQNFLETIKVEVIANQQELGIKSSGQSAQSLSAVADETTGELSGSHYFYQQIHGRKPGKQPPIQSMLEWIESKGIKPKEEKTTLRQLAYLFARKVGRSGTEIFQGKSPALEFEKIVTDAGKDFEASLADFWAKNIADTIVNNIQKV